MTFQQLIFLAVVQGLTEFLPVSSSAHLILVSSVLEWPDQGLALDVAVHLGTLLAVIVYFRRELLDMARAWLRPSATTAPERRLSIYIVIGCLPVLMGGWLAYDLVADHLRDPRIIAVTTLVFGLLLWWADARAPKWRVLEVINWRDAVMVGLAQVLALVPGVSRSGVTIMAGRMLGFGAQAAARYSFLLSIPVIAAAAGYSFLKLVAGETPVAWAPFMLAILFAALAGWSCIAVFLALLRRVGLLPFILYRLALGVVLLVFLF